MLINCLLNSMFYEFFINGTINPSKAFLPSSLLGSKYFPSAWRRGYFELWKAGYLLLELRSCFNYHSSARCDFHDEKDTPHCALAYCKCLCYLLSDAVCPVFDVVLTERHIPTHAVEEKAYVVIEEDDSSLGWRKVPCRRHLDRRRTMTTCGVFYLKILESFFFSLGKNSHRIL
ncbi:uncharacterized protein LOC129960136 isoform X2 [Argiope bruennichi]|uniref:uncharacterized protein LOC129960136 isoform X2 n=1 Tax=Argiope bruennichi TaxID=94029 RepID=UPI0024957F34|nr:uncharacterized protein LOC129960136 isoform X2 [Argiope bruennichi]XP_055929277.1 uncharacterized protein LOC129960136 isoform X2 [Argiope bruennichi]XP_055929278.1 uncharacterized protein LOC129960136 isoform X2 [Argiope bruennichi]XP_055929279.1 uncharacterized protein LOC129960136 isoform X2 [Argiope bruennichi]